MPSRESEVLNMIRPELSPEETLVYEYKTGYGGKPQLKSGEIAKKLGVSPSKVTRITQAIGRKMKRYF
jgi:DNA-directed RNA polymerase specialized sigma subunit